MCPTVGLSSSVPFCMVICPQFSWRHCPQMWPQLNEHLRLLDPVLLTCPEWFGIPVWEARYPLPASSSSQCDSVQLSFSNHIEELVSFPNTLQRILLVKPKQHSFPYRCKLFQHVPLVKTMGLKIWYWLHLCSIRLKFLSAYLYLLCLKNRSKNMSLSLHAMKTWHGK